MVPVSVVIITKNTADIINGCIDKARQITDDIIIIYNGEADDATTDGCRIYKKQWDGYSANKNKGIEAAKYNWILSIDADEIPDDTLIAALNTVEYNNPAIVYDIKFRSYFGYKLIKWGSWGRDHHIRLFNRSKVKWSEAVVHETLMIPAYIQVKKLEGCIHHYSAKDADQFNSKGDYYAKLSAKKYFRSGKRAGFVKLYLSPVFGFIKSYIIYLGFLDGHDGWRIAKITIKNTRRKYQLLSQMENGQHKNQPVKDAFVVEY
ncbi:glycosyltransferase family 2 protein [Mucilaginibacter sp.]|uniref:glycosyltransferase family 2 protein n=1 Tax=Mucilaginibacter sp. TaxID=1882438 RepID=UPI003D0A3449